MFLLPLLASSALASEVDQFLASYNAGYQALVRISSEIDWLASTDVSDAHEAQRTGADQALAAFTGSPYIIEQTRAFLSEPQSLSALQLKQLKAILLIAAENPGTMPAVVNERLAAESRQSSILDSFEFCLVARDKDGKCPDPKTANDIDDILFDSKDLKEREKAWLAAKEIGVPLKPGLEKLQRLRNQLARELEYSSFFGLQIDSYGMSVEEMMALLDSFCKDTEPLYEALQYWTSTQLAAKYNAKMPASPVPAHWYPNRWGQEWGGLVEAANLDPYFKDRPPQWIVQQAENFYVSLGFASLSPSFWEKSDLYPVPAGDSRHKNAHASAWHVDLEQDVRSLMSVESNSEWFFTSHHELGHIYYYEAYTRPEVPMVLREGANRGFHEAIGELASLAAGQIPYLKGQGFLPKNVKINATQALLIDALERTIVFMPWSAGVMSRFEYELYEKNLPSSEWQKRWWELVAEYQHMAPPADRSDEKLCDACTKTHINDDPAGYYDYAIATVIKFQLHEHIARKILKQDPRNCNYFGNKAVGDYLKGILEKGATEDWRKVLKDATGEELSTRAMMEYYAPLLKWLQQQNHGEKY
jgi:peptidyl-dipeptidase A